MENKYTARNFYNEVISANISETATKFAQDALTKMEKRNERKKESGTATSRANVGLKESILNVMEDNVIYTAAEICEMHIDGITTAQKASALLLQMSKAGIIEITTVKIKGKGKVNGYKKIVE